MGISGSVVAAQRAVDEAWAALETHRTTVDAARRASPAQGDERSGHSTLRPWTDDENADFRKLHAAVVASEERAQVLAREGFTSTFKVEAEIRAAARAQADGE